MAENQTAQIEAWFAAHDDGEFHVREALPERVVEPADERAAVIYATKPRSAQVLLRYLPEYAGCGLIGGYGLPIATDAAWFEALGGTGPLFFLGDMDPVDLLIFAWLREKLAPRPIEHLGVNDALSGRLALTPGRSWQITCSQSEQAAMKLLGTALHDWADVLGPHGASVLQSGRKIELEALVSAVVNA